MRTVAEVLRLAEVVLCDDGHDLAVVNFAVEHLLQLSVLCSDPVDLFSGEEQRIRVLTRQELSGRMPMPTRFERWMRS